MCRKKAKAGFTLVEFLICMGIIAVLVGLILPAVQHVREASNRTDCANNLRSIGSAYHTFLDSNKGVVGKFKGDSGWIEQLLPFLENNSSVFACVNDVETQALIAAGLPPGPPRGYRLRFHVTGTEPFDIDFMFDGGTRLVVFDVNVNGEYKTRMRTNGTGIPPQTGSYGLVAELGNNWDFNDMLVLVEPQPNGSIKLTMQRISAPYHVDFAKDGVVVVKDFGVGSSYTLPALPALPPGTFLPVGPVGTGAFGTPTSAVPVVTSYAVNYKAAFLHLGIDGDKVVALEYQKAVANNIADYWPNDCAVRHGNLMNVLFHGGHVLSMRQEDIDYRLSANLKQYWLPNGQ